MQWIDQHRLSITCIIFSGPCCLLLRQLDRPLVRSFCMLEAYQAVGISRWSQIKSCQPFTTVPEVTGRGSQPSKSWRLQQKRLSSRPRTGSERRPSGRSIYLLHDTYHGRNLTWRYQTRSIKQTCSSCHTTA